MGIAGRERPVEGSSDHGFVVNCGELVMELVVARGEECRCLVFALVLKESLRYTLDSSNPISQNLRHKGIRSLFETRKGYEGLLDQWIWLGF